MAQSDQDAATKFSGFEPLTANFVYCPNQFFDVCLPHYSRGVIRLVAYLLRRTLGWLDEQGNPIQENVVVSYQDFIQHARISRGTIAQAVEDAIAAGFIVCRKQPCSKTKGHPAQSAEYALQWDHGNQYIKDPADFSGFFAKEGNRTPAPNAFFDRVLPYETAAVVKVVGTVIRHTVGYQTQFGRRPQAELSYRFIQDYAKIADRSTLSAAIQHSIETGYICRVQDGCFSPNQSQQQAAAYAIRWLEKAKDIDNGSETRPEGLDRFKNQTSIGSKNQPGDRYKNQTNKKTVKKNTDKQQQDVVVSENSGAYELLVQFGFNPRIAKDLAAMYSLESIQQQIGWLEHRNPRDNKLGMLRRAIEDSWSIPEAARRIEKQENIRCREIQNNTEQANDEARTMRQKRERRERKEALLQLWKKCSEEERQGFRSRAIAAESSLSIKAILQRSDLTNPPVQFLDQLAAERGLKPVVIAE